MEVKRRKRGRPSKAVVSPPVHRAIMEPEIAKRDSQYILNVRHGWFRLENGKLIPINSGAGASMAETAAKSL